MEVLGHLEENANLIKVFKIYKTINLFNKKLIDAKINYINLLLIVDFHLEKTVHNDRLWKDRLVVHRVTTSDNGWYNEWQRMITSDNEWPFLADFRFFHIREEPTT